LPTRAPALRGCASAGDAARLPLAGRRRRASTHAPRAAVSSVPARPPAPQSKAATITRTRSCMLMVQGSDASNATKLLARSPGSRVPASAVTTAPPQEEASTSSPAPLPSLRNLSTLTRPSQTAASTNEQHSRGGSGAAAGLLLSDKGSHACASALETRATAKADLDHPFASVALVANLETVTANARLCNRPLPPAVAAALHPATRSHVGTLEMSPKRSRRASGSCDQSDRATEGIVLLVQHSDGFPRGTITDIRRPSNRARRPPRQPARPGTILRVSGQPPRRARA